MSAARPKSPDQYEQLKLNFLSKQKAALEKELQMLDEAKEKEVVESSQNVQGGKNFNTSRSDLEAANFFSKII